MDMPYGEADRMRRTIIGADAWDNCWSAGRFERTGECVNALGNNVLAHLKLKNQAMLDKDPLLAVVCGNRDSSHASLIL